MTGLYSSFGQAWQEHVPLDVHRVEAETPHACLEAEVIQAEVGLAVRVVADRQREVARETWAVEGGAVRLGPGSLFRHVEVADGGLAAVVEDGPLANPAPYRLLRARTFRGWAEVPEAGPYSPAVGADTAYRRTGGLVVHDRGGLVEVEADGGPLTVELSRPLYGRTLEVLKLAVYPLPAAEVAFDSHAVAYAWAEPDARRLGLNLRDVVTGWTLDAPGLVNSDDAGVPRSSAGAP